MSYTCSVITPGTILCDVVYFLHDLVSLKGCGDLFSAPKVHNHFFGLPDV